MDKINTLLLCSQPLFDSVRPFLEDSHGKEVSPDFRIMISHALAACERQAYARGIDPVCIADMKYALVAFIDECVMYSEWPHRLEWMGRPLQLQFFGEHLAGENFFKKLSELRQAGMPKRNVLEIYYVCLRLGFKGMYRLKGEEALMSLQAGLRSQIEILQETDDLSLEKMGLPHENVVKKISRTVPFWIILLSTIGIIFILYFSYSMAIEYQLHHVLAQMNDLIGANSND